MSITDEVIPLITKSDWYNPNKFEEVIDDMKDAVEENVIDRVKDDSE